MPFDLQIHLLEPLRFALHSTACQILGLVFYSNLRNVVWGSFSYPLNVERVLGGTFLFCDVVVSMIFSMHSVVHSHSSVLLAQMLVTVRSLALSLLCVVAFSAIAHAQQIAVGPQSSRLLVLSCVSPVSDRFPLPGPFHSCIINYNRSRSRLNAFLIVFSFEFA